MARSVLANSRGYSLIEMLIAMAFLAVVATALMKTSILLMQKNLQNELRTEAVSIAEQRVSELRARPFDYEDTANHLDLKVETIGLPNVTRSIRSATITYTVTKTVTQVGVDIRQAVIAVSWSYRGTPYTHSVMAIIEKQKMGGAT